DGDGDGDGASSIHRLTAATLAENEAALQGVWQLLAGTHYQSSSKDFRQLVDSPSLEIWTHGDITAPDAVLVAATEGPVVESVDAALAHEILAGRRRPRGQLLPQVLAQALHSPAPLTCRYCRVVRIATRPALRRHGIASRLLNAIEASAFAQQRIMGASFADTPVSRAFWDNAGYRPVHRGTRPNPRSGRVSLTVTRSIDPVAMAMIDRAYRIHVDNEQARRMLVSDEIRHAQQVSSEPREAKPVSSETRQAQPTDTPSRLQRAHDDDLLRPFAGGERSFENSIGPLLRLAQSPGSPVTTDELTAITRLPPSAERRRREAHLRTRVHATLKSQPAAYTDRKSARQADSGNVPISPRED
ncbi:MAG: hypothetical protein CSA54_05130, partial [Gammaproteobacteria bacterium]